MLTLNKYYLTEFVNKISLKLVFKTIFFSKNNPEACPGLFSSEAGSIFMGGRGRNIFIKGRIKQEEREKILPPLKSFLPLGHNRQKEKGGWAEYYIITKERLVYAPYESFFIRGRNNILNFIRGILRGGHMPPP